MRRAVAGGAISECGRRHIDRHALLPHRHRLVALAAFDLHVLSREREPGLRMIEILRRRPGGCVVTGSAVAIELPCMGIPVAGNACLLQTQEGAPGMIPQKGKHPRILDPVPRMTSVACEGGVFARQREPGRSVIEPALVKHHRLRIESEVLLVAFDATLQG